MVESQNGFSENKATPLRIGVMAVALGVGFVGALLMPVSPWGINVLIFTSVLMGASLWLARHHHVALKGGGRWLVFPILLFAALLALRDSPTLFAADLLTLLLLLGLVALRTQSGSLRLAGWFEYGIDWLQAGFMALIGSVALFIGTSWGEVSPGKRSGSVAAVLRGFLIAVPLLFVFGGLFAGADAVFQGLLGQVFNFDTRAIWRTLGWTPVWAWLVGGFMYGMLVYRAPGIPRGWRPRWLALGRIEIAIVLGLLNVLFIAFVIVQIRYFFGGAELVQSTTGLTYAEYARRGFFELVTVAALVLPVLLVLHWLFAPNQARSPWLFRVLAFVLIGMLFVIMVSAVQRMRLYIEVFGLTELRLYTTAFMAWLALVFVWFVATVLRGQRRAFASGALVLALGVLVFLNGMNPDEWIVSTNLNRPDATEPFDARYAGTLSADAIPMLLAAYPNLTQGDKCTISRAIFEKQTPPKTFGVLPPPGGTGWFQPDTWDWRTGNLGRIMAWQAVEANWQNLVNACFRN